MSVKSQINSIEDLDYLVKENLCVIIKISASWCGPCKDKKFLESYEKLKNNFSQNSNVKFVELDVDANANVISRGKYEANSVPTFLILYKGNIIKKIEGNGKLNEIYNLILNCLK
jgi:thiol-disulfide isomerase/thioredoxin